MTKIQRELPFMSLDGIISVSDDRCLGRRDRAAGGAEGLGEGARRQVRRRSGTNGRGGIFIDPALAVSVEGAWRAYRWKEQESDAGLGRRILFAMNDTAGIGISRKILFGAAIVVTVAGACGAFWMTIAGAAKGICLLVLALALCAVAGGRPSGWVGTGPASSLAFLAASACVATHPGFAGGGGRLDGAASVVRAVTLGAFGLWASVFAAYAYVRERRRAGKAGDAAIMWGPMVLTGGGASGAAYGAMLLPESRTVGAALGAISMLGAAAVAWVVFWAIRGTGVTMSPRRRDAARSRARERAASETATGGAECETGVGTPDGMETGIVNEAAGGRAAYAGGPAGAEGAAGGPGAGVAAAWNARAARAAALGCAACFLIPVPIVAIRWFRYEGTVREGIGKFESGDIAGAAAAFREAGSLMAALGAPRPLAAAQERVSNVLEARGDFAGSRAAWLARLRTLGLPDRGDLRLVALKLASGDDGEFWNIFVRRGET
ncbi:MAG: hypothetical protein N3A38_01735, partial [Planctomycetota bacterium]|nr:hypothetical protein [Planctomycetota bacterium]